MDDGLPTWLMERHDNLVSIAQAGLNSDRQVGESLVQFVDIGNANIKKRRRGRRVPVGVAGMVDDHVPFYFTARSPMLYAIHRGNVPTYTSGQDEIVYLVSPGIT